ncbi:iron-containing alcohol dehydrogenase [Natronospirillum operosum]|uniref:Iron-containing alcohol dehydrogenase n=1 Tax=Natronospirillum operosum TaxID=2759953 RepID=A0A4Z0WAR3_9GAMM|nr:iron-containing alcohol dehydrogenase [Natronospirillum operosum]TGG91636.1 iron-containing alcohol dehydrogenase [Natronospirillum operosum]
MAIPRLFKSDTPAAALTAFEVARLPAVSFGPGRIGQLPAEIRRFGQTALLITGGRSFVESEHWSPLTGALQAQGVEWHHETIRGEPSPERVDSIVDHYRAQSIDVVVGIGGGSPLDAAKAIAGLLRTGTSVMDHLEGVGRGQPYTGPAVPMIAVPTTAGTGSEATKNAVLSQPGANGFKKSFRDDQLVPALALLDPDLLASCPKSQIAANGMDAFTQLLESYVSANASPFTDALAWSGLQSFRAGFWPAWEPGHPESAAGYGHMLYAAWLSGVTLAQAGLGSVHGLASPLGAFFPIPHGVVCGTLVAAASAVNISALQARAPDSQALPRYAEVGRLLTGDASLTDPAALTALVDTLNSWTERLQIPRLSAYGVTRDDFARICANARGGSMKTNPIVVTDEELERVLERRL